MAWYDDIYEAIGESMASAGASCLEAGFLIWQKSVKWVNEFCRQNPTDIGAWGMIQSVFDTFMGIGAALLVLYFVMGWLYESVDIRDTFTLENMFRFFIRLSLTSALLSNGLTLIKEILRLAALLTAEVGTALTVHRPTDNIFKALMENSDGSTAFVNGLLGLVGGFMGMMVMLICGMSLLMNVGSRFFKLLLCIPFAPIALASFAGGQIFSSSGIAWIKTFLGHSLEIVLLSLALITASKLFDGSTFFRAENGVSEVVAALCNICLPLIAATVCVKGSATLVRKSLGL
jgi:hypothetical protein